VTDAIGASALKGEKEMEHYIQDAMLAFLGREASQSAILRAAVKAARKDKIEPTARQLYEAARAVWESIGGVPPTLSLCRVVLTRQKPPGARAQRGPKGPHQKKAVDEVVKVDNVDVGVIDDELAMLIRAWSKLPAKIRRQILSIAGVAAE
jgi:hypothetical protein